MAQQTATISLCLFIILTQHLFNWGVRKTIDIMGEHSAGLVMALIVLDIAITIILFRFLLVINK
jgi:hypothetical protein